jgi:hypothetical protein
MDVAFKDVDKMPPKGYMTPKAPGSPDYSPAGKVGSPTEEDLKKVKENTPSKDTTQKSLLDMFNAAGRRRKSRKTKRRSKKSRRTRRR